MGKPVIVLPYPPSLNHAYITTRQGKRIMTTECRNYKKSAWFDILAIIRRPLDRVSSLTYRIYFPDNRQRDTDNVLKIVRDCLKESLVKDDRWQCIGEEHIYPAMDKERPRVEITWEV